MEGLQMRILIAEEDKVLGDGLADYLRERCGHIVTVTADSQFLQQTIQETNYHIVLLSDNLPPQPSGVRLARFVKEQSLGTEVIVYTDQEMTSATAVLATGAYRYWAKPLDFEEVAIILQRVGEQRQLRGVARQNHILAELMATSTALLSGQSVPEILDTILHGVQNAFDFDRIRLYLLAEDDEYMVGEAEVGVSGRSRSMTTPIWWTWPSPL
jgi:DNA-binding NtrC family response regulator